MQDVLLPDGSVFRYDDGAGVWRHVPDVATANAIGVDFNNLDVRDELPGPSGEDWPSVVQPEPAAAEGEPPPPPPPPSEAPASIEWGGRTWTADDLAAFIAYLRAHGVDYSTWAQNHPAAAAVLEGTPTDPQREPVPKSIGEALADWIAGGASAADAADQVEPLRAALVKEGVSGVTPAQLLEDAKTIEQTYDAEQDEPPPTGQPTVSTTPTTPPRALQAVNKTLREAGDFTNLPPIPYGFKTISNDQVTEALVISAALIEHADPWITLGTCQTESSFNVETVTNVAGAKGPMQVVNFPAYTGSPPLIEWVWGNLIAGARLLAKYGAIWNDEQQKMSAAYNAGQGAVTYHWPRVLQWLEVAGHPEDGTVQDYVDKVARFADSYRRRFGVGWNIDPGSGNLTGGAGPPSTQQTVTSPSQVPAGVLTQWRNVIESLAVTSPKRSDALQSKADSLISIFR